MYIIEDRVTPHIQGYLNLLRTKNVLLRHWPTTFVDTVEVFDRLYFYNNGTFPETTAHKKIYHLLNIDIDDIKAESYDGVESAWLELNGENLRDVIIEVNDMEVYIDQELPVDAEGFSEWVTVENIMYDPVDTNAPSYVSDADIINRVKTERTNVHYDVKTTHQFLALVLMDRDNEFFEAEYTIVNKHLGDRNGGGNFLQSGRYVLEANLTVKFRRKVATGTVASDSYLGKLKTFIEALDDYDSTTNVLGGRSFSDLNQLAEVSRTLSVNKQLYNFLTNVVPTSSTSLVYIQGVPEGTFLLSAAINSKSYIRYDGMAALNPHEFSRILTKIIDTDFEEEDTEWWEDLLMFIAVAAIVVISAGYALGVVGSVTGLTSAIAFATTMAIGLAIGQLVLGLAAYYLASKGHYAQARLIGDSLQILGMLSTILSIIAMASNGYVALNKMFSTALSNTITSEAASSVVTAVGGAITGNGATIDSLVDKLFDGIQDVVSGYIEKNLSGPMDFLTGFATDAFSMYTKYIDPPQGDVTEDQAIIDQQKEELEQLSASQDSLKKVRYLYDSPYANIYDFNEYMQNSFYLMTQGTIEEKFTRYYS